VNHTIVQSAFYLHTYLLTYLLTFVTVFNWQTQWWVYTTGRRNMVKPKDVFWYFGRLRARWYNIQWMTAQPQNWHFTT